MRRPAPSISLSPRLLKQFAGVTVIVTGMVALFANGEAAQLQAEVEAREARNELLASEAERLGTRKIASSMKVKARPGGWGGDGSGDSGGGGEGSIDPDAPAQPPAFAQQTLLPPRGGTIPRGLPQTPGATVSVKGQLATDLSGPQGDAARAREKGKAGYMNRPDAQQILDIKAASQSRTGGAGADDF